MFTDMYFYIATLWQLRDILGYFEGAFFPLEATSSLLLWQLPLLMGPYWIVPRPNRPSSLASSAPRVASDKAHWAFPLWGLRRRRTCQVTAGLALPLRGLRRLQTHLRHDVAHFPARTLSRRPSFRSRGLRPKALASARPAVMTLPNDLC
jgi:hypothetical protein